MVCLKKMGSLRKATIAAFGAAGGLALIWIMFSTITRLESLAFAVVFGAVVSGVTMRVSGGHGPLYQLVATSATILGILIADTIVMLLLTNQSGFAGLAHLTAGNWSAVLDHFFTRDPYTFCFMVAGVVTGLFIWRPA